MNPIATYSERSPGLRREFRLHADHITVSSRMLGGNEQEIHIPLDDVSPRPGLMRFRVRRWIGGFLMSFVLAVFVWLFVGPFHMPWTSPRVVIAGILSIGFFIWGLVYLRKFTAYRFLNRSGVIVLDVIESGPEKDKCKDFVAALERTIRERVASLHGDEPVQ